MLSRRWLAGGLSLSIVGLTGSECRAAVPAATVSLEIGTARLSARVADDPQERERGLMHVQTMGQDEGMVFVYPEATPRFFWMKDTPLPLDIAFVGADERIIKIAQMKPLDTMLTPSDAPTLWVVEAHAGWFARVGAAVGDRIVGLPPRSQQ